MTAGQPPDFPTIYASEFAYVWKTLRRLGYASAMVALVAAIPVLATIGYRALRDTTTGRPVASA